MAKELTGKTFKKEVLESDVPVMVDFWASWCTPCRMMAPVVEDLAEELKGKVKVAKVNIEEEEALATEYGIMSIPTFLVFKGGKVIADMKGVMPKEKLLDKLNNL